MFRSSSDTDGQVSRTRRHGRFALRLAPLAAILVGILIAGCGSSKTLSAHIAAVAPTAAVKATPTRGGVLRFARSQDASVGLNPINAPDNGSIFTIKQIFDPLVTIAAGTKPVPALAKSWDTSSDGKVWTFHLRDAKFSDGSPVTAEDAAFSLTRFADPKINVAYTTLGASIKSVKAVDAKTVRVTLRRVDGAFLDNIAMFAASVVPKKIVESESEKQFGQHPVGSGPFKLTSFKLGQRIVLARNPYYWRKGYPLLDGVDFEFTPDANTRVLELRSGTVDVADAIPPNQVASLNAGSGVKAVVSNSLKWDAIWLANKQKPLDDVKVRQALNYATPRQQILKSILFGNADLANSLIARVKYWDKNVKGYPYDIAKAKALMAASSAPHGFKLSLVITAGDPVEKQTAEVIKSEWAKIGVNVSITEQEFGAAFSAWLAGKSGGAITFPGDALSSDTLSDDELSSLVYDPKAGLNSLGTRYDNPAVLKLLSEANSTLNETVRAHKFAQIQQMAMNDAPAVPLFFTKNITGVRDNVQGLVTYPAGWWNLGEVSLKK